MRPRIIVLFLLISLPLCLKGQDHEDHEVSHEEQHEFKKHQLGIVIGHTHISRGITAEGKKFEILPSWALMYNYKFNEKWGIGFHVDMILEDFEVERQFGKGESEEILLRQKPIAPTIVGLFRPTRHSGFELGFGFEYAPEETLVLTRIGYEWSTHIDHKWELVIPLSYDIRWDAYDAWNIGLGVVRMF
jgi:hypothetical protein